MKRRSWVGFFSISLFLSVVGVPSLEASEVSVIVVDGEKIHAEVQGAELKEVLKALADKAGLRIVVRGSVSETVALQWKGIPLQDAVRDLLRKHDHILVYEPTSGGPMLSEVWVLGGGDTVTEFGSKKIARVAKRPDVEARSVTAPRVNKPPEVGKRSDEERVKALEGSVTVAMREFLQLIADLHQKGDVARATELLRERINDPDPQIRMYAFSALTQSPDPRATEILAEVVRKSPDLALRRMATNGLSQRGGAESVAALAQALKEEPDPEVRHAFLLTLGRMGQAALPAVSQAASDPDPAVARTAQRILRRVKGSR